MASVHSKQRIEKSIDEKKYSKVDGFTASRGHTGWEDSDWEYKMVNLCFASSGRCFKISLKMVIVLIV